MRTHEERLADLYAAHASAAIRLAYVLTRDASVAEDIAQEAFVRVGAKLFALRAPERAAGYLFRTVANLAKDHGRSLRRRSAGPPAEIATVVPAPEVHDEVLAAMLAIAPRHRLVLFLRYYLDMSEQQAAQALGVSPSAVKSLTNRAIVSVRKRLEGEEMNEDRLRAALQELDNLPGSTALPPAVARSARRRRVAFLTVAGAVACVAVAGAFVLRGDGAPDGTRPAGGGGAQASPSPKGSTGWTVRVSVGEPRVGPLELSVSEMRPAEANDAEPWLEHDLVIENQGDAAVEVDDTRTSVFIPESGAPILLVADQGCGYGVPSPGAPVEAGACRRNLDAFTLEPGDHESRVVTLYKELAGMSEVHEGTYVFDKLVRFSAGEGPPQEHTVRLMYEVTAG